jgi:hypothetical protein
MGGKTSRSSQEVTIPPEVLARYNAVNARAESTAERPFQRYSNDPSAFVAQLTDPQRAGISQTMQSAQQAQPFFQAATGQLLGAQGSAQPLMTQAQGLAQASARDVTPGELQTQQFMSPYISNVVEAQRALTQRQQEAQMSGAMGQAIRSGAYGGDRAGIAAANLAREQQLAQAGILSPLLQQGYTQALQTAQQQQGLGLSAEQANRAAQAQAAQLISGLGAQQFGMGAQTAQQLAGLGTGAQGASLQGAQAQMGAGQMAQQTEQAGLQALYNQFLQEQSYPFQVAQFLANIAMGTGALSGSTTTTRQPGGFFSDSRLKEDIEEVGKLHDGQPIFKFRYKGEPREATKIGLMADEVEHDKPEAVGLAGGFRTVNYDEATKDAASMGGGVMPRHAGEPFARGGYADGGSPIAPGLGGGDLAALLQAQAQMYSPYMSQGPYMGASSPAYGGGAYVPGATLPVTGLVSPSGAMPEQPDVVGNVNEMAKLGENIAKGYGEGKKRGWWGGETTTTTTPGGLAPTAQSDEEKRAVEEIFRQMEAPRTKAMGGGLSAMPFSGGTGQGLSIPQQAGDEQLSLGRAAGGSINPYGAHGLSIPSEIEKPEPLKPADIGPGRSPFEDVKDAAQIAASIASISDRRAKTDIAPVGKLNNGEEVYRYRLKGDPKMQIGLMADEVEERHPEAVGLAGGMKTLDYEAATDDAVKRAAGGVAGGRRGYATDGLVEGPSFLERFAQSPLARMADESQDMRRAALSGRPVPGPTPDPNAGIPVSQPGPGVGVFGMRAPFPFGSGEYRGASSRYPVGFRTAGAGAATAPSASPAGGVGAARPPTRPSGAGLAPTQTSDDLIAAGRPSVAQLGAAAPAGLAGTAGMTPAEQQAALAAREKPAGMSSTGRTAEELAAYRPPTDRPGQLRGDPGRAEVLYQQALDKAKGMGLNKAENLIPLLTGIAAMGTAPTRSLGVALASGVGAGAQSYLPTRQALEDIKQTQATTGGIGATTAATQAQTLAQYRDIYARSGFTLIEDPNGKIDIAGKRYAAVPKGKLQSGSQPIGEGTQLGIVSPDVAKQMNLTEYYVIQDNPALLAASIESQGAIRTAGQQAQQEIQSLGKFGTTLGGMIGGSIEPGVLAGAKSAVAKYAIDIVRSIGGEEMVRGLNLSDLQKGLVSAEVMDKLQQMAARQASESSGGDTIANLKLALEMMAGKQLQPEASAKLIAGVMSRAMQNLDLAQYTDDYTRAVRQASGGDDTLGLAVNGAEIRTRFSREPMFSPAQYQRDENTLGEFLAKGLYAKAQASLMSDDPKLRAATQEAIARKFGNPLAYRYFLGRY